MLPAGRIDPNNTISANQLRDVNLTVEDSASTFCNGGMQDALTLGVSFCALGTDLTKGENNTVPDPYIGYRRSTCHGDSGG